LLKNYKKTTIQLYKREREREREREGEGERGRETERERETLVSFDDEEGQRVASSIDPGNKNSIIVTENDFSKIKRRTFTFDHVYNNKSTLKMNLHTFQPCLQLLTWSRLMIHC
jgi:hypothetical protein